ncbi:MAG: protoheme IX farnesyltransferase [Methanobacteriota archaeon]|nr:MAG: protoheme IX farnesyltransferase [Euryarchaeota archaeon]
MARAALADYVGLLKLRIAALLLLVAASGYLVTSGPDVRPVSFLLLMGSGLLASAGASAVNHYADRDLDPIMVRTRNRPIPQGRVPPTHALFLGLGLLFTGLVLAVAVNFLTALFILFGFVVYVFVYTLGLKRRNVWNIVIGGFAGSCPALAGSAAASGGVGLGPALIALLVFLWTPGHFWALAFGLKKDYREAGLPMLPALLDDKSAAKWIVLSTAIVPPFALSFWVLQVSGFAYLAVAIAAGAWVLYIAFRFLRTPTTRNALAGYRASGPYLAAILLALIADKLLPHGL